MENTVLTEDQAEKAHDLAESFAEDIHADLDSLTREYGEVIMEAVRQKLADEFRFWKN